MAGVRYAPLSSASLVLNAIADDAAMTHIDGVSALMLSVD